MPTILTINWNTLKDTQQAISSVLEQDAGHCTIYLLDNNSQNAEGEQLEKLYANDERVKVFCSPENLGFARGCNFLLEKALAPEKEAPEYIILLNNDAIADKNWVSRLTTCAEETGADIVASKMVQQDNPERIDNVGHFMLNTGEILPLGHGQPSTGFTKRMEVAGACGGACLIRTALFKKIGGFDEHFFVGYEDAEFGLRALLTGHKIVYEPTAVVHHKMGASIEKIFDYQYTLTIYKHIFYTALKLLPASFLLVNFPFWLMKYTAVFLLNLVFFRFKFVNVMCRAGFDLLAKDSRSIIKARHSFQKQQFKTILSWQLQRRATFFLWYDIKRFWRFYVRGKKTKFERF